MSITTVLGGQIVFQAPGGQPQPVLTRARDRAGVPPPLCFEVAVRFPQPATPALVTNPIRIKLALGLCPALRRIVLLVASELTLKPRAPPVSRL